MPFATGLRTVGAHYDSPLSIKTSVDGGLKEAYAEVNRRLQTNYAAERPSHVVVEMLGEPPVWCTFDYAVNCGHLGLP